VGIGAGPDNAGELTLLGGSIGVARLSPWAVDDHPGGIESPLNWLACAIWALTADPKVRN
jgi:hypothetical protein